MPMLFLGLFLPLFSLASEFRCDICGMDVASQARNHIIYGSRHLCSLPCLKKAKKIEPASTRVEVMDFNAPQASLPGERAFFLVGSKKIKADLGSSVMSPYFGAFKTLKEAEAAQARYGDGQIVEGIDKALE